jgi:hypothetical protein
LFGFLHLKALKIELGRKESVLLPDTNLKRKNQESGLDNQEQLLLHHHLNIA